MALLRGEGIQKPPEKGEMKVSTKGVPQEYMNQQS
jgi:hypothetical protein